MGSNCVNNIIINIIIIIIINAQTVKTQIEKL